MTSIHDITTKVFKTEFGVGHYTVLLYDQKDYEHYEMSNPMDRNGVNMMLSYGEHHGEIFNDKSTPRSIFIKIEDYGEEISMEELMLPENLNIRTAIKIKQENFYND